jgi:hypothetical protein
VAVAHREPLPAGDQYPAEDTVEIPAETAEEITQPLPRTPGPPAPADDRTTTGLPLLDVLAPEQTAPPAAPAAPTTRYGPPAAPVTIRRTRPPQGVLLLAAAVAVILIVLIGWLALRPTPTAQTPGVTTGGAPATGQTGQPAQTTVPDTTTPTAQVVGGYQFVQHAARSDTDCAGNAYGQVADFLRATPCAKLDRALYTTTVDGQPAVVSVSAVQMGDESAATQLQKLADTGGTGNVADLLRAGVRVPGGPASLTDAGYASSRSAATVVIVESDFADPAVKDRRALDRLSTVALQLHR